MSSRRGNILLAYIRVSHQTNQIPSRLSKLYVSSAQKFRTHKHDNDISGTGQFLLKSTLLLRHPGNYEHRNYPRGNPNLTLDPQFAAHNKTGTKPSGGGAHPQRCIPDLDM